LRSDHRLTGINQLLDKQVAAEWVPRSRLPFGNILKIARQKPDATRVAGLWAWNQLGRKVKKGEKGIRILAPIIGIRRKPDEEGRERHHYAEHPRVGGFHAAYVFERLSRDLWPGLYAPGVTRDAGVYTVDAAAPSSLN